MSEPEHNQLELPGVIRDKLVSYQRSVWKVKLIEGLLAAAFGLLVSYLAVLTLDRFFETSGWVRGAILLVGALGLGLWFPFVCHKWIWQRRQLKQVARLLRKKFPRFGDQMLGVIELVQNPDKSGYSQSLVRAALKQVENETADKSLDGAVPDTHNRRWIWAVGIPAALALVVLACIPAAGSNAFARWLMPWRSVERFTFTKVDKLPDELVVPVAESSSLEAELTSSSRWNPGAASAYVDGVKVTANRDGLAYDFKLPALKEPTNAYLKLGDARKSININPQTRPELTSVSATVKLPEYLQRTKPLQRDIRGGSVSIVDGSRVGFEAVASRDLVEATLDGEAIEVDGKRLCTASFAVPKSRKIEIDWLDSIGLRSKSPLQLRVHVENDEEPTLVCDGIDRQVVLLEKEMLKFKVNAQDDYGIKTVGIEWRGQKTSENPNPAVGEKIVAAGNPEATDLDVNASFSPKRENVAPQSLAMRVFVEDYLPNRERVYSSLYRVYVLTEDEHAVWLTRELNDFYKSALEVYERESALHQKNKALSGLTVEELDRPEKRRELEAQALAERAQARKLNSLTDVGEKLVKEAVRNEQFLVGDLERLAKTLNSLKAMSKNQMPSVAGLLKQASSASAAPSGQAAPTVIDDKSSPSAQASAPKSGGANKPGGKKAPSVAMNESSMDRRESEGGGGGSQPSSGGGKLGLAEVKLAAVPSKSQQPGST